MARQNGRVVRTGKRIEVLADALVASGLNAFPAAWRRLGPA